MAYNFNGTTQYLNTATSPIGNSLAPITMACWVKGNPAIGAYWVALGRSTTSTPLVGLTSNTGGVARVFIRSDSGSGGELVGTSAIFGASTPWAHTALTNSSASRNLYVNGMQEATNTGVTAAITLDRCGVGALVRNSVGSYFNGDISEVGIWNVALTSDEVASLAKGMTCDKVRPSALVFYAPLVRDLIDVKGGLTITNNNSATVADHPRVYA